MPRDGSNIYHYPPGIEGVTDQPIESPAYNSFISDVEQDLNLPRPIIAGGTGTNNASDAMDALGGEVSKIQVTNYDSHPFKAGSFYSEAGATNAPVPGHAFAGVCYSAVVGIVATTDMFIEARDRDDGAIPPAVYVRQKKNNVWGSWMVPGTGGPNPSFSGVISLNGNVILSGPTAGYYNFGNIGSGGNPGVAVSRFETKYGADKHTFLPFAGSTPFVEFTSAAATFITPVIAGSMTCVAPALTDNSTRVPTTAWVNDGMTELINTTPDFPQVQVIGSLGLLDQYKGKHLYHPATDISARSITIGNSSTIAWPIGTQVMFVNFGGPLTLLNDATASLYLAGRVANPGNCLLSGTSESIATIMKVATGASSTEWIVWGTGVT